MTSIKNTARILAAAVMLAAGQTLLSAQPQGQRPPFRFPVPEPAPVDAQKGFVNKHPGNPYLPLWEHLPDGEPRVFEDPDNPGHYRVYIIGSHDLRYDSYCGPDIRMWSAPVEDLTQWRNDGAIFTYNVDRQWDVMYAPDLVEVKKDGKKVYYLYPHSRGVNREAMVCVGDRPDGPFTPVNTSAHGTDVVKGSILGFDPSVYVEEITDPSDPDYETGFRAYGFWGFQRSSAAQLDQNTMYSVRPGTEIIPYFIPASYRYGQVRHIEGVTYPALYKDQKLEDFNFFEASSIRKVGNKFVWVFSGHSGPDYGLESSNSTLRYAYGDSPMGPWRSGGVLVDSRAVVPSRDGSTLQTSFSGHNTHGSLLEINGQWYVFYHRAPRGFGFARQPMVAPVTIEWDEKPVAEGGQVRIYGYDPAAPGNRWTAKASNGDEYTGAEVTSEGFHIFGLDPYAYYSAGYACYLSDNQGMQDSFDIWDNNMDVTGISDEAVVGFKYFGFGGLDRDSKGIKAFRGTAPGNRTAINLFITPRTDKAFIINVMMDGPWTGKVWKGKRIARIEVPAGSTAQERKLVADVSSSVDRLSGKHAIYLVAEGPEGEPLFDLHGLGFSRKGLSIEREAVPAVGISIDGKAVEVPAIPVRSTNANGLLGYDIYEIKSEATSGKVSAVCDDTRVKISVTQAEAPLNMAEVRCDLDGVVKTYRVRFHSER